MSDTKTDIRNAFEIEVLDDLDAESAEVIKAAIQKNNKSLEDQDDAYRIWRCNGLPVGLRIHRQT